MLIQTILKQPQHQIGKICEAHNYIIIPGNIVPPRQLVLGPCVPKTIGPRTTCPLGQLILGVIVPYTYLLCICDCVVIIITRSKVYQ